jgi:DNA-binding CsgD family transcriptional regulator
MSNNNNTNDFNEREGRVLELYDQGKSTREIAKELRMSLRDIGFILKKGQVNHGIATIMDNGNNSSNSNNNNKLPNEKDTQAYKLFSEGRKPLEVAIELGLREKQVNNLFREFWKLKRSNKKYLKIKGIVEEQVNRLLIEHSGLLISALLAVVEALRLNPDRYAIIYNTK